MSEVGNGIHKFSTAKQFASWLRLSPNTKISGGRVLSSKIPKGSNRLKIALRNAAEGSYKPETDYEFLDQKRKRKVMEMKKLIHKFDITPDDLGLQLNTNNL